jgi:hypothetical protein
VTWYRLDDKSAFHRKVLKAGNEAWGAHCRAGAVSSAEETDGRITLETCLAIAPLRVWTKLIGAGLVDRIEGSTDLQLHDFLDWNPSAEEVRSKREARAAAGHRGGIRSGQRRSKAEAIASPRPSNCLPVASPQNEPPSRPDPIRSDTISDTPPPQVLPGGAEPGSDRTGVAGRIRDELRKHTPFVDVANDELAVQLLAARTVERGLPEAWIPEAVGWAANRVAIESVTAAAGTPLKREVVLERLVAGIHGAETKRRSGGTPSPGSSNGRRQGAAVQPGDEAWTDGGGYRR